MPIGILLNRAWQACPTESFRRGCRHKKQMPGQKNLNLQARRIPKYLYGPVLRLAAKGIG